MKRFFTIALLAATAIGLGACAHKDEPMSNSSTGTYQSTSTYSK